MNLFRLGSLITTLVLASLLGCNVSPRQASRTPEQAEPRPVPLASPPDAKIQRRLEQIFSQLEGLREVRVRVRNGVVHLDGRTDTLPQQQRAAEIAGRLEKVVYVDDAIEQRSGLRTRVALFFARIGRILRSVLAWLPNMVIAIFSFLPFFGLSLLLRRWRHPLDWLGVSQLTSSLIALTVRTMLIVVGLLISLDMLGIMGLVGVVVGTLGLLGLLGGLVFKDWVANYFPGLLLGVHPPFSSGDLVQVGEHEGRVLRITPRATVLMTLDGEELRVPNVSLLSETMINFSHHRRRRLRFRVFLAPQADLDVAEDLGSDALVEISAVEDDPPPFMRLRELTREAIEIEFLAWVNQDRGNFRSVESLAKREVLEALVAGEVPLAIPELVVRLPRRERRRPLAVREVEAEARDQAFLDQQVDEAQSRSDERDFLAEGRRRGKRAARGAR